MTVNSQRRFNMRTWNIVEVQAWNDGRSAVPAGLAYQIKDDSAQADEASAISAFYSKCALAAVSSCDTHTIMMLDGEGDIVHGCKQTFRHGRSN